MSGELVEPGENGLGSVSRGEPAFEGGTGDVKELTYFLKAQPLEQMDTVVVETERRDGQ